MFWLRNKIFFFHNPLFIWMLVYSILLLAVCSYFQLPELKEFSFTRSTILVYGRGPCPDITAVIRLTEMPPAVKLSLMEMVSVVSP